MQPIICFDCLTAEKGDVLIAIAHPGEIAVIVHTEGRLENVSLPVPTDSLAWPKDFACRYLRMSEFPVGSVLIAAYYCGVVCVWSISLEPFHCDVASSFSIPHLSSLFLLHDWLLAATTDNRLLVWYATNCQIVCVGLKPVILSPTPIFTICK